MSLSSLSYPLSSLPMSFPFQNITISTGIAQIPENVKDAIVGEFSTVDDDPTQTFTYTLVDNAGGHFKVDGRLLKTAVALDYETNTQFTIRIKTTDSGSPSKSYERDMIVYVQDINEKPTALHISHSQVRWQTLHLVHCWEHTQLHATFHLPRFCCCGPKCRVKDLYFVTISSSFRWHPLFLQLTYTWKRTLAELSSLGFNLRERAHIIVSHFFVFAWTVIFSFF